MQYNEATMQYLQIHTTLNIQLLSTIILYLLFQILVCKSLPMQGLKQIFI